MTLATTVTASATDDLSSVLNSSLPDTQSGFHSDIYSQFYGIGLLVARAQRQEKQWMDTSVLTSETILELERIASALVALKDYADFFSTYDPSHPCHIAKLSLPTQSNIQSHDLRVAIGKEHGFNLWALTKAASEASSHAPMMIHETLHDICMFLEEMKSLIFGANIPDAVTLRDKNTAAVREILMPS